MFNFINIILYLIQLQLIWIVLFKTIHMYLYVTFYVILLCFRTLMETSIADQAILIKDIQMK